MIVAMDTETSGTDLFHGAKPYFVTTCDENGKQLYWEWKVDAKTREPIIPKEDIFDILAYIDSAESIVFQNGRFDIHALSTIIPNLKWDWSKNHDTIVAAHVLRSNEGKRLDQLSVWYLEEDIQKYEDRMEKAVKECHAWCRKYAPSWRIAKRDLPEMPSAKNKVWKYDTWLPSAVADYLKRPENDTYRTVTREYANKDSWTTLALWKGRYNAKTGHHWHGMETELKQRGLWGHYQFRMKNVRIAWEMEHRGLTYIKKNAEEIAPNYERESGKIERQCVSIAEQFGYDLEMPKKGINNNLRGFLSNVLKLPPVYKKDGAQTYDKDAMKQYSDILPSGSSQSEFVKALIEKSKYDTSLSYLKDYVRYTIATDNPDYLRLHPNLNPTGSNTLRWTHNNPNSANISTKEDAEGKSLRYCFGPAPGREWWSCDAKNVELRIPFYESGETEMIALFESPDEPPYYGSNHILVFSVLHEALWYKAIQEAGIKGAAEYVKTTLKQVYKTVKNGNFAIQYGSGESNSDRTYGLKGAYRKINSRFTKLSELNRKLIAFAQKNKYVETLPDRTVDATKGYPLLCTRTESGSILTTVPLSYHVQGSAMWLTGRGMNECDTILECWRVEDRFDAFMTMQVHDEIVFDLPKREDPRMNVRRSNLPMMREIQRRLSQCGDDFVNPVPVPFGLTYHSEHWGSGVEF